MTIEELERQLAALRAELADVEARLPGVLAELEPANAALEAAQRVYDEVGAAWVQSRAAAGEAWSPPFEGQVWRPHSPEEAEQARETARLAEEAWTAARDELQDALVRRNGLDVQRSDLTTRRRGLTDRIAQAEAELARERELQARAERERYSLLKRVRDRLGVG